ncbi:hypothetical protein MERGE_000906 [Pneumocystis wakefieldiae]|uniref:Amine oxidase domain-containing protein n=1 Tax=Pneumocystis wakefieldiae TaxID=38082 RepID=A0A899G0Z1_9ASCO|nr:hypothetical protein MERGE_000906 [Pneumocystis wakefieldiae]
MLSSKSIGILGGGISGLSTACHLIDLGDCLIQKELTLLTKICIKSTFPNLWNYEELYGSVLKGFLFNGISLNKDEENIKSTIEKDSEDIIKKTKNTYIYSFKNGLGTLSSAISKNLFTKKNVRIYFNSEIQSLKFNNIFKIKTNTSEFYFDHLISALPIQVLTKLLDPFKKLTKSFSSATILVVNLFFDNPNLLPFQTFGYLIPKSVSKEENPEQALGVIFDRGSFWKHKTIFPKESEFITLARNVVLRHLGIKDIPVIVNCKLQKNSIPQYNLGHHHDLKNIHNYVYNTYQGNLSLVGNFYGGIGVNDCIKNAYFLTRRLKEKGKATGLESVNSN